MILLLVLVAIGYPLNVYRTGRNVQSDLQADYDKYARSQSECLRENISETGLTDSDLSQMLPYLVGLSLTEIIDTSGEPGNDPISVNEEMIWVLQKWFPNFLEADRPALLEVFTFCRGATSPVYDQAVALREWVEDGTFATSWIRNSFPNDELRVLDYRSGNIVTGEEALEVMSRVLDPVHRGLSSYQGTVV